MTLPKDSATWSLVILTAFGGFVSFVLLWGQLTSTQTAQASQLIEQGHRIDKVDDGLGAIRESIVDLKRCVRDHSLCSP